VAVRLAGFGVGEGSRVATTLGPGMPFVALLHAAPRLGAALVPLDPRLPGAERERRMETAGADVLVDEPLDPSGDGAAGLRADVDPDSVATVVFTSGTTASARPVELTHGNHAASAIASAWNLGVDPADRWLSVLPPFHVGGLSILIRSAVYGTTAAIHDGFDPDLVREELEGGGTTLVSLVPTMLRGLRTAGLTSAPGLRAALLGGGPIPPDLLGWARELGLPVLATYGMTETASQVATAAPEEALAGERGARPLPGVELDVAETGEILVRGPMVAPRAVAPDGWLHTGDLGHLDAAGRLHVTGRLKDVIVTGGENVSPTEVEAALMRHPAVVDAGVVGVPDPEWGEAVTAFVVLSKGAGPDELGAHCRELLAPFQVPKRIEVVASLPRNAAGKLLRSELLAG
jgi:o-succinylbenzoate---CoA ligase